MIYHDFTYIKHACFLQLPRGSTRSATSPVFCSGAAGDSLATGMRYDHQLDAFKAWMTWDSTSKVKYEATQHFNGI